MISECWVNPPYTPASRPPSNMRGGDRSWEDIEKRKRYEEAEKIAEEKFWRNAQIIAWTMLVAPLAYNIGHRVYDHYTPGVGSIPAQKYTMPEDYNKEIITFNTKGGNSIGTSFYNAGEICKKENEKLKSIISYVLPNGDAKTLAICTHGKEKSQTPFIPNSQEIPDTGKIVTLYTRDNDGLMKSYEAAYTTCSSNNKKITQIASFKISGDTAKTILTCGK